MRKKTTPLLVVLSALLAPAAVRGDTVEVTSTTLLTVGQQTRGGAAGVSPDLVTVAPAFEILSITASEVTNPLVEDLRIVVSTWGSVELADLRWDNGTTGEITGDVQLLYAQGRLWDRRVTLRLGRTHVMSGAARAIQLDGGEVIALLPAGVKVQAYAGSPVAQRFASRSGLRSWNPQGGDLAYGGRLGWSWGLAGFPGRGVDAGVSAAFVDEGDAVRQDLGADFRVMPNGKLQVFGYALYALPAERFAEANLLATYRASRRLFVTADWRYTAPDLFLPRTSILSVFSDEERNDVGAGAQYELGRGLAVGADYHAVLEPGEGGDTSFGSDLKANASWKRGPATAGLEVGWLDAFENGYTSGRLWGRREFGKLFAAADVVGHAFRRKVNGEDLAITGQLTGGIDLARGLSAVVSGRAGVTPFLEQTYDAMVKLVYNQTYRAKEVK
jgi:hypothetical protein